MAQRYQDPNTGGVYELQPDGSWAAISAPTNQTRDPAAGAMPASLASLAGKQAIQSVMGPSSTPAVSSIGATPVGSAANGGTMMSDGTISQAAQGAPTASGSMFSAGNITGGLAALKGGYDVFQGYQHGGEGMRSGMTELGGGVGQIFGGPLGAAAGAALGNVAGYGAQGNGFKNHLALAATMPALEAARLLGVDLNHKTTKQFEQERWGDLQSQGDDKYKATIASLQAGAHPEGDTGEEWKKVEATAMQDPTSMWGTLGMLNTFGPDYLNKFTEEQRYAATKYAIDNKLLKGDHGDIVVTDPNKLKTAFTQFSTNKDYEDAYKGYQTQNAAKTQKSPSGEIVPYGDEELLAKKQQADAKTARQSASLQSIMPLLKGGQASQVSYQPLDIKNPYLR